MRRSVLPCAVVLLALVATACDHPPPSVGDRENRVLQATIRAVVDDMAMPEDDSLPVVYVVSIGEGPVAATVQAEVVTALDETVDVRFADNRDEAIDANDPERAVKSGGVLLLVGDIASEGRRIELPVQVYVSDVDKEAAIFSVASSGDDWNVTASSLVELPAD